jgi:RimJ/RimL family protein N-acetyltransferase
MNSIFKKLLKRIFPKRVISIFFRLKPNIYSANIYLLKRDKPFERLRQIDSKFMIRQLSISDSDKLKEFYKNYKHIFPRLKTTAWVALGAIDTTNGKLAYVSWVIKENIDFINDFNINLNSNQFMVRHGYCSHEYRHQGLHTRMEYERLNYCFRNGAKEIFVHIASHNEKGIAFLKNCGYEFYQKNTVINIPLWGIHRRLSSFLRSPFKRVM